MAEIIQPSPTEQTTQTKKTFKQPRFLYYIEGVSALIVILFILFALNYLNIFRLDSFFPSLSALPRFLRVPTQVVAPTAIPKIGNIDFKYDDNKAKQLLSTYLQENMKSQFITDDPIKVMDPGKSVGQNTVNFGKAWSVNGDQFIASFIFLTGSNFPLDLHIVVLKNNGAFGTAVPSSLSSGNAQKLFETYFKKSGINLTCTTNGAITKCENFTQNSQSKSGYGAILDKRSPQKPLFAAFSCTIFSVSPDFAKATSCVGENSL
ncbi:MAG TPA: hypothetical protein VFQ63_01545 [Patescibacteria group bacterium]|nr:hypothetical protein [Patescibacteria group bacterium]